MKINKTTLLKFIVLHLGLMVLVLNGILLLFFKFLLPALTHHGQFITVPNLKGITLEEVDAYLTQRNLRFEVTQEFAYAPEYPPMAVLQQYPKAGAHVKEGRKIYLTLNTQTPPKVKMPHLVDGSIRNAHVRLKSQGLRLGNVTYVPDVAQNAVLEQWYQGKEIPAGTSIIVGAKIDLVVGAGLGNKMVEVPAIVGMQLADAKSLLFSTGIQVGNIAYEYAEAQVPGTISKQHPNAGQKVPIGDNIDIWLAKHPDETGTSTTPMLPGD
ncbi:MAG: PASTA domain-containing protein [Bacteroidota bacterium]